MGTKNKKKSGNKITRVSLTKNEFENSVQEARSRGFDDGNGFCPWCGVFKMK
jgi:hypothetical protein